MKKLTWLLAVTMTAAMVLTGCGGSSSADSQAKEEAESSTEQKEEQETKDSKDEKVVTTSLYWDYYDLDPATFAHKQPNAIVTSIYETLVTYDENMELQPLLAESWDINNDGLEYIFHLRKGVQFHRDYGELKASDVVFTFQRMKDIGDESTAGTLVGVNNFEVTAEDDYTVKFTLKEKDGSFLTHLSLWCGFIVSEAAVTDLGEDFERTPIGTGPFEFVSATFQESTEMKKFDGYWGEPADIDRVIAYYITDSDTMYTAFESGQLNMVNSEDTVKTAEYMERDDVNVIEGMSNQIIGFGLSTTRGPLADIRVRQAIFHAIDIDDFIDNFLGGVQSKTSCMIPESCAYALQDVFHPEYDVEKAKELLAEAGYADGFDLELGTYNDDRADAAVIIQSYLAEIGINVKVTPLEIAAFGERAEAGEFDIWYCGWSASILPDDFMVRGFKSDGIFNYSQFNDPKYDELITNAAAELDEAKRGELYGEAQKYLAEQYVYYPMYTLKRDIITTKDLSGNPFTILSYPFNFQAMSME